MKALFYNALVALAGRAGQGIFLFGAWWVATGYFLLFPRRVAVGFRFYRALFPSERFFCTLGRVWRQFHQFPRVHLDRMLLRQPERVDCESLGFERLEAVRARGTGAILLMSHLGHWEMAARVLQRQGMRLLLYMGEKQKEQIESLQKYDMAREGIRIVAAKEGEGSPFALLEGVRFLQEGGFVSLAGDRLWSPNQRFVSAAFCGHEVRLPEAPYALALLSGCPLFCFFVRQTGRGRYRLAVWPLGTAQAEQRKERQAVVRQLAQEYAAALERQVFLAPEEWYHFEPFLGEKMPQATGGTTTFRNGRRNAADLYFPAGKE